MVSEIQGLACDRHKNVAGLNQLMVSELSPLEHVLVHEIMLF